MKRAKGLNVIAQMLQAPPGRTNTVLYPRDRAACHVTSNKWLSARLNSPNGTIL